MPGAAGMDYLPCPGSKFKAVVFLRLFVGGVAKVGPSGGEWLNLATE